MKAKNLLIIGGVLVLGYVVYKKMSSKKAEAQKKAEEDKPKEITITSTSGQIGATPTTKSAPIEDSAREIGIKPSFMSKLKASRIRGGM